LAPWAEECRFPLLNEGLTAGGPNASMVREDLP